MTPPPTLVLAAGPGETTTTYPKTPKRPGDVPLELRGTVPPPPFIVHHYPRGHVGNPHGWRPEDYR